MFTREDSEYWLKKTQEIARIGSWGQDPRTGGLWWSDQTYLLFDLDPQGSKMTIDRFMSFVHPDDLELVQQVTALALKSDHSPYKVGCRVTLPNQAERYIYQEAQVERDNCGEAVRVVGIIQDVTEHKHDEKLLLDSEQKFRLLVSNAHDWEYWINPQGEYVYVSPACEKITGYTPEEFIATPELLCDIVHSAYVERVCPHFRQENNSGTPAGSREFAITTKDGEERWIIHYCRPVFDAEGQYLGRCGNNRDITERKQAEIDLRESHNQLDSIFRASPVGIGIVVKRQFKFLNGRALEMLGYSEAELYGINTRIIYASDAEFERVGREHVAQIEATGTCSVETVFQSKNGKLLDVMINLTPLDFQDLSQGLTFIVLDITIRKLAEKALQESEARFKALHDASFGGVIIHEHGLILDCNQALSEITGFSFKELVGMDGLKLIAPDFLDVVLQNIKSGYDQGYEVEGVRKDGSIYPLAIRGKNVFLKGREVRVVEFRDITELKEAEENRRNLETQLHQKNKMEAVGLMAGGMAHNFNNNLAIILGNLELSKMKLADNSPISEIGDFINNAKIAVLRSRDLVQQIQTYSRNKQYEKVPFILSQIVGETVKLLRSTIPSTIDLQQTGNDNIAINGDPSQLQEVLINLCNNAIHAMAEKGTLTISLEVDELRQEDIPILYSCTAGNYAKISVQDTGTGMPVEIQEKVFDPFFTTKEVGVGTGMGLPTVQGIVSQHNGMIKVISEVGVGTTFDLYLPIIESRMKEHFQSIIALPSGTEKILFVDDEELLANVWSEMLNRYGYKVTALTDSVKALELFKGDPAQFDLIISDQTMPVLCGKEFLREVVNIRPSLPTIICTGFTTQITEAEAKQMGITEYCLKPLELPLLLQTIRRVLDDGKG